MRHKNTFFYFPIFEIKKINEKIMHYVLSLLVPNEKFKEVINVLKQDEVQQ